MSSLSSGAALVVQRAKSQFCVRGSQLKNSISQIRPEECLPIYRQKKDNCSLADNDTKNSIPEASFQQPLLFMEKLKVFMMLIWVEFHHQKQFQSFHTCKIWGGAKNEKIWKCYFGYSK